jgi:DNA mismatch repair protein MutL
MLEVLAEEEDLSITGFISPISLTRSNRREISFFVNGRPVQDPALGTALVQAYHTLLMVGRYPLAILFLQLPPESVDVNVHPTKAEVRFKNADLVFRGVQRAVRRALLAHSPVPSVARGLHWGIYPAGEGYPHQVDPAWGMSADSTAAPDAASAVGGAFVSSSLPRQSDLGGVGVPILRLVGQIASAYLVAEGPDGLYLIDQHAAHERVLFESFIAMVTASPQDKEADLSKRIPAQILLQPVSVDLQPASARSIEDHLPILNHMGFQAEVFARSFLVRAILSILAGMDPVPLSNAEDFGRRETPLRLRSGKDHCQDL